MIALVCLVEYDLSNTQGSSTALRLSQSNLSLRTSFQAPELTTVVVGASLFFPLSGSRLKLRSSKARDNSAQDKTIATIDYPQNTDDGNDELAIEIPLRFGELSKHLSPAMIFIPPPELVTAQGTAPLDEVVMIEFLITFATYTRVYDWIRSRSV